MINVNDLRSGMTFLYEKEIYLVIESNHSKSGRGQAHVKTKVKNLNTGTIKIITFTGGDIVYPAMVETRKAQYLYQDNDNFIFMDEESFDQIIIPAKDLIWEKNFLIEGESIKLKVYHEKVIGVELKPSIIMTVSYTEPGIKGNSATNTTKPATLVTGYKVQVPLFINTNDKIIISTIDGTYKSRA
ncbi:MAG: elongation factor P [Spiroplasma sp.]|nr:elongation factor P [Spiroplasma sp.]